jgi:hypothetical protein
MRSPLLPVLDPRVARQIRDELLARRPAYVPDWLPSEDGPDAALVGIVSRYLETLLQRLNLAPDKNRLTFLDLLGIEPVPAQAARATLVFQLAGQAADLTLPAGSHVAAPAPPGGTGATEAIVFETERAAGLAGARLRQVVSLWPGRDQFIDHSADLAAGRSFQPFRKALLEDTPHVLYIAHDTLLNLAGRSRLDVRFELVEPSNENLSMIWEYWDGTIWRGFKGMRPGCEQPDAAGDGTAGLSRSGRVHLETDCAETAKTRVNGIEAFWIRGRLVEPLPLDPAQVLPLVDDLTLSVQVARPLPVPPAGKTPCEAAAAGLEPEKAFFGTEALDTSKSFYPLGQSPRPGDAFFFANEEIFSKPGAEVTVRVCRALAPTDNLTFTTKGDLIPVLLWEYWNGRAWQDLAIRASEPDLVDVPGDQPKPGPPPEKLLGSGTFRFRVPDDIAVIKVNDQEKRWLRARLQSGGYGIKATTTFKTGTDNSTFTYVVSQPPALAQLRFGYTWEFGPFPAERVLTFNDFQFKDHTFEAKWPGLTFLPFEQVSGLTPTLYLGFDRKLPVDRLNLFFDIREQRGDTVGPTLIWEYWNGINWSRLSFEDETAHLRVPGLVSITGPEDAAPLNRFGAPLFWLRARLAEDGPPGEPVLLGIFPNAIQASQRQTVLDERLGVSSGLARQVLGFRRFPVLAGEEVQVQELSGPRANVEWRILAREVLGEAALTGLEEKLGHEGTETDVELGAIRLVRDRNKKVIEAWVRWEPRRNFLRSGPGDRHYVIDRTRGRLRFGDGEHGKVPPSGAAVLARSYRTGGGALGNVAAGAIQQALSGVPGLEKVTNPRPAEGGADAETAEAMNVRGPFTLSRRGRALTAAGIESLAREASPAVAVARVVPNLDPSGRQRPGWVTLILLPLTDEPRPFPSFGLREQVRQAVEARMAADMAAAHHLHVTGPDYLPVDVQATVSPVYPAEAGQVERLARAALATFLHPLQGGPDRQGWPPGRGVFLSDVAATLERVPGLDAVLELALLLDGQLQGEQVAVPPDRIVVAGTLRIKVV